MEKLDALIALFPNSKEIIIGVNPPDNDISLPLDNDFVGTFKKEEGAVGDVFSVIYKGVTFFFVNNETFIAAYKSKIS